MERQVTGFFSPHMDPEWFEAILCSLNDGVFCVDRQWRITCFNRAASEITGVLRDQALGRKCYEVFRSNICKGACALKYTMETGRPILNLGVTIINAKGRRIPISISTAVLKDKDGRFLGGVETFRDLSLVEELKRELQGRQCCEDIISKCPKMTQIFDMIPPVAESDSTVLISGESGTGKGMLARAIHNMSHRKDCAFVTVNCSAIPETLLESELFGYKKGAFTNAFKDKPGRFSVASGGTVFLDEVGDIPPSVQAKLLRVLQERVYEPLGSVDSEQADVRIIAATNRDLERLVQEGKFRMDLYYRINVIHIKIPALRERLEDVPLLVDHFISRFAAVKGKEISGISPRAMALLMRHDYPGNVRELENIIEHAFALCPGGLIQPEHLPDYLRPIESPVVRGDMMELVDHYEKQIIMDALKRNNWSRIRAARDLGIHKTTLFRKIKRLGITLPSGGRGQITT